MYNLKIAFYEKKCNFAQIFNLKTKTMKKQLLFLAFATIGLLTSCSSDDNSGSDSGIAGTYTLVSVEISKATDANGGGVYNEKEIIDAISCDSKVVLTESGNYAWDEMWVSQNSDRTFDCNAHTYSGTYETADGGLILTEVDGDYTYTSTMTRSGNTLKYSDVVYVYTSAGATNKEQATIIYTYRK